MTDHTYICGQSYFLGGFGGRDTSVTGVFGHDPIRARDIMGELNAEFDINRDAWRSD